MPGFSPTHAAWSLAANLDMEICRFYLNDSPSLLLFKHLATSEAPPDQGRMQKTFPD